MNCMQFCEKDYEKNGVKLFQYRKRYELHAT